ncbi:MAG: L,D-transpeptidase [Polyangiaceae bacterium]
MATRRWLALPLLGVAALCVSCPRTEAPQQVSAPGHAAAAPPPSPRAPAMPSAQNAPDEARPLGPSPPGNQAIDTALPLPPELVDDGSDDWLDEPVEAEGPAPDKPAHLLGSVARETWIYTEPRWGSRRIGYLRAGARVTRRAKPAGFSSCEGGWYRVEPHGYVCNGSAATLDMEHPVLAAATRRPRMDTLPYTYVMSRNPSPPVYARLPTVAEQAQVEPDLRSILRGLESKRRDPDFVSAPPADALPATLQSGRAMPLLANAGRAPDALLAERAKARSGYALLATFDDEGRRFGMTTELGLVPIDRTRIIRPSSFSGMRLDEAIGLPVAFVKTRRAVRHHLEGAALRTGEALEWRQPIPLGKGRMQRGGQTYWQALDGSWVRADQMTRVDRFQSEPSWAGSGRKWIDVSILKQSLTAYEGGRPVYVTLVSTGADGLGDPDKTHSTIQGAFLIHTKHVTATMDGDDVGDEFDLRDVPFVQYFTEGYALHGAYWHDDFGTPRSHGCVNLAPLDAAWLFGWTTPDVPATWHGALTLRKGTLVYVHP